MILEPQNALLGRKGLVLGIANGNSIAYGCARASCALGAELAVTLLNEKARPFVEPPAIGLDAPIVTPSDVHQPGQLEAKLITSETVYVDGGYHVPG